MIQAFDLELLEYLKDNKDENAKRIKQEVEMEITKEKDMTREEESINQEIVKEEKKSMASASISSSMFKG